MRNYSGASQHSQPWRRFRQLFGGLLMASLLSLGQPIFSGTLTAQTIVTDTIVIDVTGSPTTALITASYMTPVHINDSIIFRVDVQDEMGNPLDAIVTFITPDSTALQLSAPNNPQPGRYEALGVALKLQQLLVWAVVDPIDEVRIASFRDNNLNWTGFDTIPCNPDLDNPGQCLQPYSSLQYCAYAIRGNNLVVESPGPPACPTIWLPATDFTIAVQDTDLFRLAGTMYGLVRRQLPIFNFNAWASQRLRVTQD